VSESLGGTFVGNQDTVVQLKGNREVWGGDVLAGQIDAKELDLSAAGRAEVKNF
jgi:hypothetical protein